MSDKKGEPMKKDKLLDIAAKDKRIAELEAELRNASAETACCIKFLENELSWENFRAEGFIGKDAVSASTRNCQKLAAFLKECGNHGAQLLAELAEANRKLELMPALDTALAECVSGLNDIAYVGDPRTTKMANATLLKIRPSREAIAAIDRARAQKPAEETP